MKETLIAIFASIVFVVIASFNNVHGWPLVAPFIGGIAVMNRNKSNTGGEGYGAVLKSALVAALITIVLSFLSLLLFSKDAIYNALNEAGYQLEDDSMYPLIMISLILGAIFFVSFLIGTALGALVFSKKS